MSRRSFSMAQDTFMYTLLKEHGHMWLRLPLNVVRAIGSNLTAFTPLLRADLITQDKC